MASRYSFAEMSNRVRMMDTAPLQAKYAQAMALIAMYPDPTQADYVADDGEEAMAERVADFIVEAENELGRRWIAPVAAGFAEERGTYAR